MATLESAFNPGYSEKAAILTGNPNRVTVEVEGPSDKRFWKNILSELCPQKEFHFDPYSHEESKEGKGKARIIKGSKELNDWHIACIDSDYDWLLSAYTTDGKAMNGNRHLLQTYAYSIENLMCESHTLSPLCQQACQECTRFNFEGYLTRLSESVYPLLLWSLCLVSLGETDFTPSQWRPILINTEKKADSSLQKIKSLAKEKADSLHQSHADHEAWLKQLEEELKTRKGLTPANAYFFVRGHELFDHLLHSILEPELFALREKHFKLLRDAGDIQALQDYQALSSKSPKELLSQNFRFKETSSIYAQIKSDVGKIWD